MFASSSTSSGEPSAKISRMRRIGYIEELCDDLWLLIFDYIASDRWRQLLPLREVHPLFKRLVTEYLSKRTTFMISEDRAFWWPRSELCVDQLKSDFKLLPGLKRVRINSFEIRDEMMAVITKYAPNIEQLCLDSSRGLKTNGFAMIANTFNLKYLNLSYNNLQECDLAQIIEKQQGLETLVIWRPGAHVTGNSLQYLGPSIKTVWIGLDHINNPSKLNDALIALTSGHGKNITKFGLAVKSFHNIQWKQIEDKFTNLKSLRLEFESGKFNANQNWVTEKFRLESLAHFRNLEIIYLTEMAFDESFSIVTDLSLRHVFQNTPKLQRLHLSGGNTGSVKLTDRTIKTLVTNCPNVSHLSFINCGLVDNTVIEKLGTLPKLTNLQISSTYQITTEGIANLLKVTKSLREVRIFNTMFIDDDIIDHFVAYAKSLPREIIKLVFERKPFEHEIRKFPRNLRVRLTDDGWLTRCPIDYQDWFR